MSEPQYLTIDHLNTKDITRIFSKIRVNLDTGCWEWQGKLSHGGKNYGCVWFRGKEERAHRVMYAWLVGPVPIGVGADISNLDHEVCDNKRCCNPAHLVLKSQKANVLRSENFAAKNARKTHCPQGHPYTISEWTAGTRRTCQICHNDRAIARRQTIEGHARFLEYHKEYRERPGQREKYRDATRRFRERQRLKKPPG